MLQVPPYEEYNPEAVKVKVWDELFGKDM